MTNVKQRKLYKGLSKSEHKDLHEIMKSIHVPGNQAILLFNLNQQDFNRIGELLEFDRRLNKVRQRWRLNFYDFMKLNYFAYFYRKDYSEKDAAKKATSLIEFEIQSYEVFTSKYRLRIEPYLKYSKFNKEEKEKISKNFKKLSEVIEIIYSNPIIERDWETLTKIVISLNYDYLERGLKWKIWLEPKEKETKLPKAETLIDIVK